METFLALLMALGIFVGIPIIIAYAIIGVYRFKVLHVRVPRTGEVVKEVKPLEHRGVQLTILVLFCVYYPISYYFGEIVKHLLFRRNSKTLWLGSTALGFLLHST